MKKLSFLLVALLLINVSHAQVKILRNRASHDSVTHLIKPLEEFIDLGKPYFIGEHSQGGLVFYIDASKDHGLVAANYDQTKGIQWSNGSFPFTNSNESGIGIGKGNTQSIIKFQGIGNYAAFICSIYQGGGFNDWYLPSKYELNLMWLNIGQGANNVGGFSNNRYWSSSEISNNGAWFQIFGDGSGFTWAQKALNGQQGQGGKDNPFLVRAVRAF